MTIRMGVRCEGHSHEFIEPGRNGVRHRPLAIALEADAEPPWAGTVALNRFPAHSDQATGVGMPAWASVQESRPRQPGSLADPGLAELVGDVSIRDA